MRYMMIALVLSLAVCACESATDSGPLEMIHGECSDAGECGDGLTCVEGLCIDCYDVAYHSWYVCDSCTWAADAQGRTVEECRANRDGLVSSLRRICSSGSYSEMLACYASGRCDCE